MCNYAAVFLSCAREESGNIDQRNDGNIESVAKTNKACPFTRCIDIEHTCQIFWLIGHDTDRLSVKTSKSHDNVSCVIGMHLEKFAFIDDSADYFIHVVGFIGAFGYDFV